MEYIMYTYNLVLFCTDYRHLHFELNNYLDIN